MYKTIPQNLSKSLVEETLRSNRGQRRQRRLNITSALGHSALPSVDARSLSASLYLRLWLRVTWKSGSRDSSSALFRWDAVLTALAYFILQQQTQDWRPNDYVTSIRCLFPDEGTFPQPILSEECGYFQLPFSWNSALLCEQPSSESQIEAPTSEPGMLRCLVAPCGGGLEYLHRSPASRKRRRKGNPVPGGITGSPCSWGT
jgi:hypothetical protein